jgi:hypothetical protein
MKKLLRKLIIRAAFQRVSVQRSQLMRVIKASGNSKAQRGNATTISWERVKFSN